MADGTSYPQIPTTVWWGVRALFNKSPRAPLTEDSLGTELGVQSAAARQYLAELKRVGLLNDENRATELAHRWRLADTYTEAVQEILSRCYDEGLLAVATSPDDRAKAVDWFRRQGLGDGSARNKAATYFLVSSPEPGEAGATKVSGTRPARSSLKVANPPPPTPPRGQTATQPRC